MGKAINYDRYKVGDRVYVDFKPYFEPGVPYTISDVFRYFDDCDQYGFKDSYYVANAHRIVRKVEEVPVVEVVKYEPGDTVKFTTSWMRGMVAKVVPAPDNYINADPWFQNRVWTDVSGEPTHTSVHNIELVSRGDNMNNVVTFNGKEYTQKVWSDGTVTLTPVVPTPDNAPVGSLWNGPKGGVYIVLKDGKVFEARAQAVYDHLPKSATFVSYTATVNIVKGEK